MMSINFIANTLTNNGGTTFLIRVSKELHRKGTEVKVLVLFDIVNDAHLSELRKTASVVFLRDYYPSLYGRLTHLPFSVCLPLLNYSEIHNFFKGSHSVHVMGIFGLVLAKRLQKQGVIDRVTIGIYHQNEFMYQASNSFLHRWVKQTLAATGKDEMLFFNEHTRQSHARMFNPEFSKSLIVPIGITRRPSSGTTKTFQEGLIISVGNLEGFKTYNKHIINAVSQLKERFPKLQYDIYGLGPELDKLQQLASKLGVSERVRFMGILDYALFDKVVGAAHVFVGNGTAVLEAANLGVPAISGIESHDEPVSYGFISQVQGYDYNEFDQEKPTVPFKELLVHLFAGGAPMRKQVGDACRQHVGKFDISVTAEGLQHLGQLPAGSKGVGLGPLQTARLFCSLAYIKVLDVLGIDQRFRTRRNQGNIVCA